MTKSITSLIRATFVLVCVDIYVFSVKSSSGNFKGGLATE